ncbi:putative amino acid permease [Catellatospora sp. TT07R-123]|uniref:APC family permease n=1 Tax=Catellatospora sp. TT07R-123 TaxID=2733863 RepID=UPI001B211F15|nr:APC family permease [Catellatospora sp. TT07R-123]GHJ44188.1 putative amino acid permease [Catellatospora sp. TT07R-123]
MLNTATEVADPEPDERPAPEPATAPPPVATGHDRDRLSVIGGLAALSLDAMASVAYGPEAIVLVLAAAGGTGLGFTLPVTAAIAALLIVLVFSYRQVIAAFPDGGGSYAVAKRHLGRRTSLTAAASLVIDYVLNVAVSTAAGVAALTSAFPGLLPYTVELCLAVLGLVTLVNLRGIAHSARTFIAPTALFVGAVLTVIVAGLLRGEPAVPVAAPVSATDPVTAVGALLLLKAFANGCAALTGVEAIANAVPAFRAPAVRRAQRAEVALGVLLGVMLLGLAVLISRYEIRPVPGKTVLAQVTDAALGHGVGFYLVQITTTILLALAANTSFGGLPVLAQLLARDNFLPHVFALRARRQVYRYGVLVLSALSALLLVFAGGQMNTLVPLFAIGVFVGFTIAQVGMVRHWRAERGTRWRAKAALNAVGAVLTGAAAVVTTASKFADGAWIIALALPVLVLGFEQVHRSYRRIGERLQLGRVPDEPCRGRSVVVVPVGCVSRLTHDALACALSLGDEVVALHAAYHDEPAERERFRAEWEAWHPHVPLAVVDAPERDLGSPVAAYIRDTYPDRHVFVLIAEVEPSRRWERILRNNRGNVLDRAVRRGTGAIVCRMRFPVPA